MPDLQPSQEFAKEVLVIDSTHYVCLRCCLIYYQCCDYWYYCCQWSSYPFPLYIPSI